MNEKLNKMLTNPTCAEQMSSPSCDRALQLDAKMRESFANDVRRHKRHSSFLALLAVLIVCAVLVIAICAQVMYSYDQHDGSRAGANAVTLEELLAN